MTLIALHVLHEKFSNREAEWTLIAKKAKNWLITMGLARPANLIKKMTL